MVSSICKQMREGALEKQDERTRTREAGREKQDERGRMRAVLLMDMVRSQSGSKLCLILISNSTQPTELVGGCSL